MAISSVDGENICSDCGAKTYSLAKCSCEGWPIPAPESPTLRDQFAMAAITGLLANRAYPGSLSDAVTDALTIADYALTARSAPDKEQTDARRGGQDE